MRGQVFVGVLGFLLFCGVVSGFFLFFALITEVQLQRKQTDRRPDSKNGPSVMNLHDTLLISIC